MKVALESTGEFASFDPRSLGALVDPSGRVRTRLWKGTTQRGTPVWFYVMRVAVRTEHAAEFDAELEAAGYGDRPDADAVAP